MRRLRLASWSVALSGLLLLSACSTVATSSPTRPQASQQGTAVHTVLPPNATPPAPQALPDSRPDRGEGSVQGFDLDAGFPIDPSLLTGELDNGLRYFIRRHTEPKQRAEIWLVIDAGSVLEDDDQLGVAHFVEHMAFNGTRRFERSALVDYLESIGMQFGADINAHTAFDETVYTLRVPTDDPAILERAFDVLEDWASGVSFDPEEVDKERGVVIEEWRLGRDAEGRVLDRQIPVLLEGSRYAKRLPIGDPEIIRTVDVETIRRFYKDWYRPDLMAVIAVGDFDPEGVRSSIEAHFGGIPKPVEPRTRELFGVPERSGTRVAIDTDAELTSTSIELYHMLPPRPQDTLRDYRKSLVEQVFHQLLNQRLYELSQAQDPPFAFAFSTRDRIFRTVDVDQQVVGSGEGRVLDSLGNLALEIERVTRFGFTEIELDRAKKEILRSYELANKDRETSDARSLADELRRVFLEDEPVPGIEYEFELAKEFVPSLDLQEINSLATRWSEAKNRVVLISGPPSANAPLPGEERILRLFDRVATLDLKPWEEKELPQGDLMAGRPEPGSIVERRSIDEIGVEEWKLSNGATVILKATEFGGEEVFLEATSAGGHSLASDDDYVSASFAAGLIGAGGLGPWSAIDLDKILAGRAASVRPYINELYEGVSAGAAPDDLELMLQLVYLSFTEPRRDERVFESFKAKRRPGLENRLADPQTAFYEKLFSVIGQEHPRRRPLTPERLDTLDLDVAYRFYQERFADAADFRFVIVGGFDPAVLAPLVETYIASLPSKSSTSANGDPSTEQESWRDVGARPPEETVKFELRRGQEPKSQVWLTFTGDAAFSREESYRLTALSEALSIRLREVLREDLGATYGVGVSGSLSAEPSERYSVSVRFGTSPERTEELIQATRETIAAFQRGEIDEDLVAKVREIERRRWELGLESNRFWLSLLDGLYTAKKDPRELLDTPKFFAELDVPTLTATAQRYLHLDRYILGILLPEDPEAPVAPASEAAAESPSSTTISEGP